MSLSAQNTGGHPSGPVHQGRLPADAAMSPDQVCLVTRFSAVDDAAFRKLVDELRATAAGVAFAPDITNPTYSATKAALHSLVQSVRLQLERDGSPIKVFEFMAPLVDSPFSAGVVSDRKMPATDAIAALFDGVEREELELHVGMTADVHQALRRSSDAAARAVNAATGG